MKRIALLIAAVVGLTTASLAQPAYINYQGRLLDAGGQPLTNGTYALEFKIFDSPNGTNVVWGPFRCDDGAGDGHAARAVVANGRFNVILGTHDTIGRLLSDAFLEDERFVEIMVNGGDPILPRQEVLSAPYALQSQHAQLAQMAQMAVQASNLVQQAADALCPPGSIIAFGGSTIPPGWLLCDGSAVASTNRPRLYAAILMAWGNGDYHQGVVESPANPGTDFNVPDLRGMFLRGVKGTRTYPLTMDPDSGTRTNWTLGNTANAVGSVQGDEFKLHQHHTDPHNRLMMGNNQREVIQSALDSLAGDAVNAWEWGLIRATGGSETRPVNAYVNYIIKY